MDWILPALAALVVLHASPKVPPNAPQWIQKLWTLLTNYAAQFGIPLGFAIGWIKFESGGRISDTTECNELGYFQIMGAHEAGPCGGQQGWVGSEAYLTGMREDQFPLLATNSQVSLFWGFRLAARYAGIVDTWGYPNIRRGTEFFWRCVKLCHAISPIPARTAVQNAQGLSWEAVVAYNSPLANHFAHIDEVFRFGGLYGPVA